jgi:hypothetical protein
MITDYGCEVIDKDVRSTPMSITCLKNNFINLRLAFGLFVLFFN